jgi:hypothetical protein
VTSESDKIVRATAPSALTRDLSRIGEEHSSWGKALAQHGAFNAQLEKLVRDSAAFTDYARTFQASQQSMFSVARQLKQLSGESATMHAIRQFRDAQLAQDEQMRRILAPLEAMRANLGLSLSAKTFFEGLSGDGVSQRHFSSIGRQTDDLRSIAQVFSRQVEESKRLSGRIFEGGGVAGQIQAWMKDFEHANSRWRVPNELTATVGSLKWLDEKYGGVSIPTIDWASASALANALGPEGVEKQLSLVGVEADGSLQEMQESPQAGILSRPQSDVVALVSLILTILLAIYAELSSRAQRAEDAKFQSQATVNMEAQARQIQSLTALLDRALVQAAARREERFVVRERTATVRSKPVSGASIEGKLLPREVVRAISREGKWVQIDYYHWFYQEYRSGWVLKKYLERVPANYPIASEDRN